MKCLFPDITYVWAIIRRCAVVDATDIVENRMDSSLTEFLSGLFTRSDKQSAFFESLTEEVEIE